MDDWELKLRELSECIDDIATESDKDYQFLTDLMSLYEEGKITALSGKQIAWINDCYERYAA